MAGLVALRIPKSGSSALVVALQDHAEIPEHEHRLEDVADDDLAFAVVRDPVDRFRSGYDMYLRDGHGRIGERFPTVDDFVAAGPDEWQAAEWGSAFWPLTYWLRDADYARRAVVMHIETFADDLQAMGFRRPPISHACGLPQRSVVSDDRWLREFYADDYRLLEAL